MLSLSREVVLLVLILLLTLLPQSTLSLKPSNHTSNYALIVSSSRYWFNYRHVINALSIYQLVKANGIPNENIILMLADEIPMNARNPFKNGMYPNGVAASGAEEDENYRKNLYDFDDIEIDYRGEDVTIEHMVHVLLGKQPVHYINDNNKQSRKPPKKNRRTFANKLNSQSNLMIYWTGHGGDQFFKFQDIEEITSTHWFTLIKEMHQRQYYNEILFFADTCQAFTLGDDIVAAAAADDDEVPNVFVVASSLRDENSYAHHTDLKLGLSVIERYTHNFMDWITKHNTQGLSRRQLQKRNRDLMGFEQSLQLKQPTTLTLQQAMIDPYESNFATLRAHVGYNDTPCQRKFKDVLVADFFANYKEQPSTKKQDDIFVIMSSSTENKSKDNNNNNERPAAATINPSFSSIPITTRKNDMIIPKMVLVNENTTSTTTTTTDLTFLLLFLVLLGLVHYTSKHY